VVAVMSLVSWARAVDAGERRWERAHPESGTEAGSPHIVEA
jgi:hypothetical protein